MEEPVDNLPCRLKKKFWKQGCIAGGFFMFLQMIEHLLYLFLSWQVPENVIDTAIDFPRQTHGIYSFHLPNTLVFYPNPITIYVGSYVQ
ncbi:glcNAc-PI synthesis protein [Caerostris extrusa]|uniref:GlcNAc-PI synthesis protein n=1 Tax=Caerostris extrusa TaxID=172846 RepID=A0AAV4MQP3_CAEEX|nr:glcNAc-PI synthesis protein [Caerostris extrusa]